MDECNFNLKSLKREEYCGKHFIILAPKKLYDELKTGIEMRASLTL